MDINCRRIRAGYCTRQHTEQHHHRKQRRQHFGTSHNYLPVNQRIEILTIPEEYITIKFSLPFITEASEIRNRKLPHF